MIKLQPDLSQESHSKHKSLTTESAALKGSQLFIYNYMHECTCYAADFLESITRTYLHCHGYVYAVDMSEI